MQAVRQPMQPQDLVFPLFFSRKTRAQLEKCLVMYIYLLFKPSMGGIGKGHLIREIDALGGIIGKTSDLSALQFKVLNMSKGEAVQGPRAQVDRDIYKVNMQKMMAEVPNL